MSRKLASIVKIDGCDPIPDTDRLSVATMVGKGWKVVTSRDEFKKGDIAVYFEIDSYLPADDERYSFLRERCLRRFVNKGGEVLAEGIRIKTIKLRGVVSQGLLMPVTKFPEITDNIHWDDDDGKDKFFCDGAYCDVVGADITSELRVRHYDEVAESVQSMLGNPLSGDAMGKFPEALGPRTDEERLQNLGDWFEKMRGRRWQVTCKHDGTSCTVAYAPSVDAENPLIVCSRNIRLKRETSDGKVPIYWQMSEKYEIGRKLEEIYNTTGEEFMVQGEVVGPGIQKDRNKETESKFLCFRIWNVTKREFVNPNRTVEMCREIGIPHVQVVKEDFPFFDEITTMEDALKFAEGKTEEGNEREGVVLKTVDGLPYASFKIVSNRYLMKQGEN